MRSVRSLTSEARNQVRWLSGQPAFRKRPARTLLRLAHWRVKTWRRTPGRVWLEPARAHMLLPPEWRGMAKLAFAFRELAEPELPLVGSLVLAGTIAVDAGAHYGDYTLVLSHAVGHRGETWAIEPCPQFMDICRASVRFNGLTNVRFFDVGLAETNGRAHLVGNADPSRTYVSNDASPDPGTAIRLRTLDDLCSTANTAGRQVSFIKIDIEGSELSALKGAQNTIQSWRPLLLVEFQEEASRRSGHTVHDLWDFIEGMGYSMFMYSWRDKQWCRCSQPDGRQANYLCVPNEEVSVRFGRL